MLTVKKCKKLQLHKIVKKYNYTKCIHITITFSENVRITFFKPNIKINYCHQHPCNSKVFANLPVMTNLPAVADNLVSPVSLCLVLHL